MVLAAVPNQASSGQLCSCSNADTNAVRLSRRRYIRLGDEIWCWRPSQIRPRQDSYEAVATQIPMQLV
eukprot:scaffold9712_cov77-Skeletonema_menzelii.AAC.1